jgi:hypothetical protein
MSTNASHRAEGAADKASFGSTVDIITIPVAQPIPERYFTSHYTTESGEIVTAITRLWHRGDSRRCLLCARCSADHEKDFCQIQVGIYVSKIDAALFSTRGLPVTGDGQFALRVSHVV